MGKGELYAKLKELPNISDIKAVRGKFHSPNFDEEYQFFIEQNIDPENPGVGTFKQKIRLGHVGFNENMVMVTEGYFLDDKDSVGLCDRSYDTPLSDKLYFNHQGEEIAIKYKANLMTVEHRYFHSSNPDNRDWQYLTTKNASADLHIVYETLKKIYEQPWIATGVSKGGMTTMYYHMMYPNDVDVCVPFVAPMCYGLADDRARDYIKEQAGTPEIRSKIVECKKWLINYLWNNQDTMCNEYRKQWKNVSSNDDIIEELLGQIVGFDVDMWINGNNWAIDIMPTEKEEFQTTEWIINWFGKMKLTNAGKYYRSSTTRHDTITDLSIYVNNQMKATFYDVNKNTNQIDKDLPYYYMAALEQGQPLSYGIDDITNIPEKWKYLCNNFCKPHTKETLNSIKDFPGELPDYTPDLYNQCIDYYQKHDDRVIFIYGKNDFWTGCGINDVWKDSRSDRTKYPTFGFDYKQQMACFIVPDHGHECSITQLGGDAQKVWDKLDEWLGKKQK